MSSVEDAVNVVERDEQQVKMVEARVNINSTGRPVVLLLPEGMTDAEMCELTSWMLSRLRLDLQRQADPLAQVKQRLMLPS